MRINVTRRQKQFVTSRNLWQEHHHQVTQVFIKNHSLHPARGHEKKAAEHQTPREQFFTRA